jgi:aspartyl-tRNA(Asn)/glutamyl-tRNA(Gln) amidotransferase subunit C
MAFTKEQLQKFTRLIRIEISDEKLDEMKIDSIIDWIDKLQKIDTARIAPMLTPATGDAQGREDIVTDGNIRDAVLRNAPDDAGKARGYFAVPKVMDE